jgi:hypothetical protein
VTLPITLINLRNEDITHCQEWKTAEWSGNASSVSVFVGAVTHSLTESTKTKNIQKYKMNKKLKMD